ncbi:hypothetical protein [Chryseobacterium sp.]|uniref:hypothetical protein n=1 Tax=Chryseobacterium sp. TaxID=1871047 RepID=UPI00388EB514
MKKNILILLLLFAFSLGFAQNKNDEKELTTIVTEILKGFQTKNAKIMNKYIDHDLGVGVFFKNGGNVGFVLNEEVDFSMPFGFIKKPWDIKNKFKIQFDEVPNYDSGNYMWRTEGLFVQQNSNIVNDYIKAYFSDSLYEQPNFKMNSDPKNSVYVTLAENNTNDNAPNGIRFILTKSNNHWILTFLDVTEYDAE